MSGLDAAAGVIGIAGVGMTLAKGLIQIADAIGSAAEEVRICASDTDLFSQMLVNLSTALKMPTAASGSAQCTALDLVDVCERVLEPFKCLISTMTPLLEKYRNSEHQLQQIRLRILWYFKHKSRVTFYQQALSQLKSTLSCLLFSINLQESRASAPQNVFIFQMQVEKSKSEVEHCTREARAALFQPSSNMQVPTRLLLPGKESEECDSSSLNELSNGFEGQHTRDDDSGVEEILNRDDPDDDAGDDMALALYIDLLSLQHKVSRFASGLLKVVAPSRGTFRLSSSSSEVGSTSTESSNGRSSANISQPMEPIKFQDAYGRNFNFPYDLCKKYSGMVDLINETSTRYQCQLPEVVAGHFDLCGPDHRIIPPQHWESLIKPGLPVTMRMWNQSELRLPPQPSSGVPAGPNRDSQSNRPPVSLSLSGNQPSVERNSSSIQAPITPSTMMPSPSSQSIELTDSMGNSYQLLFSDARSLKGLLSLLRRIYGGANDLSVSPRRGEFFDRIYNVQRQQFEYHLKPSHLNRTDGAQILFELWEQLVQPGWKVHHKFEDQSFNRATSTLDTLRGALLRKFLK